MYTHATRVGRNARDPESATCRSEWRSLALLLVGNHGVAAAVAAARRRKSIKARPRGASLNEIKKKIEEED